MAIIIGDIHGDLAMAEAFLAYKPEIEHIAVGDFVDSRDPEVTFRDELNCLELLIASDAVLLWGNHDLTYTVERPWQAYTRFGMIFNPETWIESDPYLARIYDERGVYYRDVFESRYAAARAQRRFRAAHASDGWLCTHAGISTALTRALPECPWDSSNLDLIADWLNEEFDREMATPRRRRSMTPEGPFGDGPLFYIGHMRGGHDPYGGIFWYDERWEPGSPPDPRIRQIFGHTRVEEPFRGKNHINIHIEDSAYWLFDTEEDKFVRLV
jgi:hypothetical protein